MLIIYFQVLEILQRANVNIASMNVARSIAAGAAAGARDDVEGILIISILYFSF